MLTTMHILITVSPEDEAGVLSGDGWGGVPPRAYLDPECGWRDVGDLESQSDVFDSTKLDTALLHRWPAALPLVFEGKPTGPLAMARALEVLASRLGRLSHHGSPSWESWPGGWTLSWQDTDRDMRFEVAVGPMSEDDGGLGVALDVPGIDDLLDDDGLYGAGLVVRDLLALATVIAAHVPGCGVEVVWDGGQHE